VSADLPAPQPGRRERKKVQTRQAIQEHALRLFVAQGYEATTVEQIASAAGVSHMTFFRYFPSKESVVDTDDYDPMIAELIRHRPPAEDPLTAIHRAVQEGFAQIRPADRDVLLVRTQLILATPALRARLWENQYATQRLFADALAARAGLPRPTLGLRVLAGAALAALTTAVTTWADGAGTDELPALAAEAFHQLRALGGVDREP
jgi:AcrR family transcriptional regulator